MEGGIIGRVLVIEFNETDSEVFDEVVRVLTTKEYELLCLLAVNRGQVLTYTQIYEKVWGSNPSGNERIIRFHLCNLRKKLNAISADNSFIIRCVRDVGYCLEVNSKQSGFEIRLFFFVATCDISNPNSTDTQQISNFYTIYCFLLQKVREVDSVICLSVSSGMGNMYYKN